MNDDQLTNAPGLQPTPASGSLWDRIPLLFTRPREAFEAVRGRPGWWLPGLLIIVITGLYLAMNCQVIVTESMNLDDATGPQREAMEKQLELFSDPPTWLRVVTGVGGGFGAWVVLVISGFFYHLFFRLSEGKANVGQSLGVVFWAALVPYGLRTVVSWVLLLVTGSAITAQSTGLAILVRDQGPKSMAYLLATHFGDVFMIWNVILMIIGFAIVHRVARKRAAIVTIAVYALAAAVAIGITVISGNAGRN